MRCRWWIGSPDARLALRVIFLGLCLGWLSVATVARAEHQNIGQHVTAMTPCLPGSATTATGTGVPACPALVRMSDCSADPAGALTFVGELHYLISALGRRLTLSRTTTDVLIREHGQSGVTRCNGMEFNGALSGELVVRVTAEDPTCAGGRCTLPDVAIPHSLTCRHGSCDAHTLALDGPPPPPFPLDVPWSGVVTAFGVRDPVGRPLVFPGVIMGRPTGGEPIPFPKGAKRWIARFVQAFAPCPPGSEDTVTSEGAAACANPTPRSNCATDPLHAVRLAPSEGNYAGGGGRGKLHLVAGDKRDELEIRQARFRRLLDCNDEPYSGTLTLVALVRATLADPACTGGFCTAVDTEVRLPVVAEDGGFKLHKVPFPLVGTFRTSPGGGVLAAEILGFDLRDASDNAVLSGPGYLVRCDRPAGGSCFGN
jgi:hypothetical protein